MKLVLLRLYHKLFEDVTHQVVVCYDSLINDFGVRLYKKKGIFGEWIQEKYRDVNGIAVALRWALELKELGYDCPIIAYTDTKLTLLEPFITLVNGYVNYSAYPRSTFGNFICECCYIFTPEPSNEFLFIRNDEDACSHFVYKHILGRCTDNGYQ